MGTQVKEMKQAGWVGRVEFARLVGRTDGSNICKIAHQAGVRTIIVNDDKRGGTWMFRPEDAHLYPRRKVTPKPVANVELEADALKRCVSLQPADLEKIDSITAFMQSRGQRVCFSKAVQLAIRVAVINSGLMDALNEIIAADGRCYRQGELL